MNETKSSMLQKWCKYLATIIMVYGLHEQLWDNNIKKYGDIRVLNNEEPLLMAKHPTKIQLSRRRKGKGKGKENMDEKRQQLLQTRGLPPF